MFGSPSRFGITGREPGARIDEDWWLRGMKESIDVGRG
jgi:hypothetical protein